MFSYKWPLPLPRYNLGDTIRKLHHILKITLTNLIRLTRFQAISKRIVQLKELPVVKRMTDDSSNSCIYQRHSRILFSHSSHYCTKSPNKISTSNLNSKSKAENKFNPTKPETVSYSKHRLVVTIVVDVCRGRGEHEEEHRDTVAIVARIDCNRHFLAVPCPYTSSIESFPAHGRQYGNGTWSERTRV